jgi:hypothetical protein
MSQLHNICHLVGNIAFVFKTDNEPAPLLFSMLFIRLSLVPKNNSLGDRYTALASVHG